MVRNTVAEAVDFMIRHCEPERLQSLAKSYRIMTKRRFINWQKILGHPDGIKATIDFVNGAESRVAYDKILKDYNHPLIKEAIEIAGLHKAFLRRYSKPLESKDRHKARAALKRRKLI